MINWNVIRELDKEVQARYPELSQQEQVALVRAAYHEIERELLMGASSPTRVVEMGKPINNLNKYTYPGVLANYKG